MPITVFTITDGLIVGCCALFAALALGKPRIRVEARAWIVGMGVTGVMIGVANLLFDGQFYIPPRSFLPLAVYLSGGSKGLLLGWLSALLFLKQLRPTIFGSTEA